MPKPRAKHRAKPRVQPQKPRLHAGSCLDVAIYLALLLATFAVYAQVRHFNFVNYDDPKYTIDNPHVRRGITAQGLEWTLTSRDTGNWFPLTWVSHMLDFQFFGADSGWHHLHNVLLHALAAILLCIFLQRATGARWRSALAAFLFALHPLHVESVAWVAERKDVLSACFWFLTLWFYVRYTERPGAGRYLAVALGLCLGLMAKPMVVTLPLVLLLLDYWPLARLGQRGRKAIWEKLPLLGLAGADAAITWLAQEHAGAVKAFPLKARLANATLSYAIYIEKTFWPSRLAVFYPFRRDSAFIPLLAAGLLLAAVTTGVIVLRRRSPYLLTGWGWFAVTLVPVIGLVQVGDQARADRYMYIPMVGLLVMLIWGTAEILERLQATAESGQAHPEARSPSGFFDKKKPPRTPSKWALLRGFRSEVLAIPLAAAACLACAALTWVQAGYWRNSETLFGHALAVTADNLEANIEMGRCLMASPGRQPEALPYLEAAVRIDPESAAAHTVLGIALAQTGRLPDAIAQFQAAIRLDPNSPVPHGYLGIALLSTGRPPEAIAQLQAALRLDANASWLHHYLGIALLHAGRLPEAIAELESALRIDPDEAGAQYDLGIALSHIPGRVPEALRHLEEAERLTPDPELEQEIAHLRAGQQ